MAPAAGLLTPGIDPRRSAPPGKPAWGHRLRAASVLLATLLLWFARPSISLPALAFREAPATPVGPRAILLVAAGDVTLGNHVEEFLRERQARGEPADHATYPFARVAHHFLGADVALVNLEGPLTERTDRIPKNFNFRAHPRMVEALVAGGITAVNLANNHSMDFGLEGLRETQRALAGAGLASFGAGQDEASAREGALIERRELRVGLLGYAYLGPNPLDPPTIWAAGRRPGAAGHPRDLTGVLRMVAEDVARLRARADVLVVSFHWGTEGRHYPEEYQVALGRRAIDEGAQVVLGHHPHVLQGIEAYRNGIIAYSLGNFVFGGHWDPRDKDAIILKVVVAPEGVQGVEIVPIRHSNPPSLTFQPSELTGPDAARVLARLRRYSRGFPTIDLLR